MYSVDGSKTFVKFDNEVPSFLEGKTVHSHSEILEIISGTDWVQPRNRIFNMATIDTIADRSTGTAVAGKMYFETSTNQLIAWTGSVWVELDSDGIGAVSFENRWAASFDGSDKLAVSDSSLAINGDLTLSLWFNANSFTNWNYIFNLTTFATVAGSQYRGSKSWILQFKIKF